MLLEGISRGPSSLTFVKEGGPEPAQWENEHSPDLSRSRRARGAALHQLPHGPAFPAGRGRAQAAHWLADLPPDATLSLYLHVPYCRTICTYCGCHTKAARRDEPLDAYTRDAASARSTIWLAATRARQVTHIHWGGGTPSLLGPERLPAARRPDRRAASISPASPSMPSSSTRAPSTATSWRALARRGFNRASLGVQDMNLQVQEAIGRVQPFEIGGATASRMLRDAGIDGHQPRPDVRPAAARPWPMCGAPPSSPPACRRRGSPSSATPTCPG